MPPRYLLSSLAERDIAELLEWSHRHFGEKIRLRYEALLTQAIMDVVNYPERPGSQDRREIAPGTRTYHLRYSRDRVKRSLGRVRQPRHFLLYRLVEGGLVEIGRVIHDGMDLDRHLPEDYRG